MVHVDGLRLRGREHIMHHKTAFTMSITGLLLASGVAMAEDHDFYAYSTSFSPTSADVMPGDTIHWHYATGYPHSVTFGTDCVSDGGMDEPLDGSNPEVVWTVPADQAPGTIPFFCGPHCSFDMAGVINVMAPVEPGRLNFGLMDLADVGISMAVDQTTGAGSLTVEADDGHFAMGLAADDGDVEIEISGASDVFMTDATGTIAFTDGVTTISDGTRVAIHGEPGSQFTMQWQDEISDEPGLVGIDCGVCSINLNGDMASFRYAGPFYATLDFRGGGEIPMSVIGDVSSATLTLPGFGEEANVVLPAGEHTIVLGPDSGNDDIAWLVMSMGGDEDDGGGLPQDVNDDCVVDVNDLLSIIGAWGDTCP